MQTGIHQPFSPTQMYSLVPLNLESMCHKKTLEQEDDFIAILQK